MTSSITKWIWPVAVLDLAALALTYVIPVISHLTSIPFYLIEPFRIMVLFSLIAMRRNKNALLLALSLPIFSYAISAHPLFAKAVLMSIELVFNVVVFMWLTKRLVKPFWALFASIVISKATYYLLKWGFISMGFLSTSLVSTSPWIQLIVAILTSFIFVLFIDKPANNDQLC